MRTKSALLKVIGLLVCGFATPSVNARAEGNPIQDPIGDYLAMHVPDRTEFIGTLDHVDRVKIDVDGDEINEVFVGTPYRFSGSMEVFWVGYKSVQDGYERITPADRDVTIGSFETIYAGPLTEISKEGLATAEDIEVDSPESGNVAKIGMLRFLYILNGQLIIEERGSLDLAVPEQKTAYQQYFGPGRVTRKAIIESFSREQLQQMGYTVPDWEPPSP